jgi:hypothetical protein
MHKKNETNTLSESNRSTIAGVWRGKNDQAKQKGNKKKKKETEEEQILLTFTGTIPSRLHDRVEGADS